MRAHFLMGALLLSAFATAAEGQDGGLGEIIVTAQRASSEYFSDEQPVIGLKRQADSAVQPITISSDSRDEATRKREIQSMVVSAIQRAGGAGVELVTGSFELVPVTMTTYRELVFFQRQ